MENKLKVINFNKKKKTLLKKKAVIERLKVLLEIGNPITKAEICRTANVSSTFLYSHADLLETVNDCIAFSNGDIFRANSVVINNWSFIQD